MRQNLVWHLERLMVLLEFISIQVLSYNHRQITPV